ncbi:MAG: ATP-dependent DNA helicase [Spirochaetota bacterium]
MTAAAKQIHPLIGLADDDAIWQKIEIDKTTRAQVLRLIAEGNPALPFSRLSLAASQSGNAVFRKKYIADENWLVPQRFERMVDFFLRRANAVQSPPATSAVTGLLAADANCLLTGGPGTGKSFQIATLVSQLAEQTTDRPLRITIAAPTGKAAARFANLKPTKGVLFEWSTIHRLLGLTDDFSEPRFHARHPLGVDLLIIDEISMLDLGLFAALIDALPDHARVVLAGDLGQLPAVDGMPIDHCLAFLQSCRLVTDVHLTQVHRFTEARALTYRRIAESGVAAIDEASEGVSLLHLRNAAEARERLERQAVERFHSKTADEFRRRLHSAATQAGPDENLAREVFAWLKEQTVLTTRREGIMGSIALNALIGERIVQGGHDRALMPIIAGTNNYRLGVFNGDTGFIASIRGREYAVMEASEGEVISVPLAELNGWQPAYAITVHKSQGSEYGEIWLVYEEGTGSMPDDYRLLYTAVTRAKNHAHILQLPATGKSP